MTGRSERASKGLDSGASRYTVKVRTVMFERYMRLAKIESANALAVAMGVHRSTVCRVMDGRLQPGAAFIAGALTALSPVSFTELFDVVENQ